MADVLDNVPQENPAPSASNLRKSPKLMGISDVQVPSGTPLQASSDAKAPGTNKRAQNSDQHGLADRHHGGADEPRGSPIASASSTQHQKDWGGYQIPKRPRYAVVQGFSDISSDEDDSYVSFGDESSPASRSVCSDRPMAMPNLPGSSGMSGLSDPSFYDPLAETPDVLLDQGQSEFLDRYFRDPAQHLGMLEKITESAPVPDAVQTAVGRKLDPEILDMLGPKVANAAKETDRGFTAIGKRMGSAMGPLTKLWTQLRHARTQPSQPIDINAMCQLVDQTIISLGQSHNALLFARRKALLSRFFRSAKKAGDVVTRNQEAFRYFQDNLFGAHFHEALYLRAKGSKHLREARQELSARPRPRPAATVTRPQQQQPYQSHHGFQGQTHGGYQGPKRGQSGPKKPFRGRSSSRGRGAGRGGEGQSQNRYVTFEQFKSKHSKHTSAKFCKICVRSKCSIIATNRTNAISQPSTGPSRRQISCTHGKLGKNHKRSVDPERSRRLSRRVVRNTCANKRAPCSALYADRDRTSPRRDRENVAEKGYRTGPHRRNKRPVHQSLVLTTQKRWVTTADPQSEAPEQICSIRTFQNGGPAHGIGHDPATRVLCETGPKGCILLNADRGTNETLPKVQVAGPTVSISSLPIRTGHSPSRLYKNLETSSERFEESGGQTGDIPGRHDLTEPRSVIAPVPDQNDRVAAGTPRVSDQLGKIDVEPSPADRVPGVCDRLSVHEGVITRRQSTENTNQMPGNAQCQDSDCQSSCEADWQGSSQCASDTTRPIALSPASNIKGLRPETGQPELRNRGNTISRVQGRDPLVDGENCTVERSQFHQTVSRPCAENRERCIGHGLGSPMSGGDGPGQMVGHGKNHAHQCIGNEGCTICSNGLHKRQDQSPCSSATGQYNSSSLHQQNGGHQIRKSGRDYQGNLGVLLATGDHNYCRTPSWETEPDSGSTVQSVHRLQQLDSESISVQTTANSDWPTSDRFICRQTECADRPIRQLETGPTQCGNGRILPLLEGTSSVCISPILHDKQMLGKSPERQSESLANCPSVANATMVRQDPAHAAGPSNPSASGTGPAEGPSGRTASTGPRTKALASSMANIRSAVSMPGFSGEALRLLDNARRDGTKVAYNSAWGKWCRWCDTNEVNPFQASVANVTNFLANCFQDGIEYATLNVYRSSLSAYHPEVEGFKIGQHPIVKQFMTGVFNSRPPVPRYVETWDVDKVLNCIEKMGDNSELQDKQLTMKLAMLLGLVNVGRAQEIQSLNPKLMTDFGDKINFQIARLTKTRRPSKSFLTFTIQQYDNDKLDPVACLRLYLQRTKAWRTSQECQEQLFLALVKPHRPVTSATISRWIKDLMKFAGIDTETFKAHSVRGAATSKAMGQGMTMTQVLEHGNWSKAQTFKKFYYRDVSQQQSFQNVVLDKR